ncbi:MAG: hypothetical protein PPHEMADM_3956 [uncultured Paraburkholderia sp.]|nr:MAG: hypothetical protein PPHEMADE_3903 [uncultured Paraburkholderia sp.]CAH2935407.1 MAG: hypothetical protein PPHEMADM_3956 [uncultured Paraburkholderia sp.]
MSVEPYEKLFFLGGRGLAVRRFRPINRFNRRKSANKMKRISFAFFIGKPD